ncbi:MAG: butyrate kinase [Spirochaetales bacterium]
MEKSLILAINPGSTSTKIGVFQGLKLIMEKTIRHTAEELSPFKRITDQYDFRKETILKELRASGIALSDLRIVMGRGGLIKPVPSGVYEVNDQMEQDLRAGLLGEHASNLGGLIARDIARSIPGAQAYIADPVVVDELADVARISGHPLFERKSIFHALNQKAIARLHAEKVGKAYEDLSLIVAHLGGGISIGAHYKGKVIDVNQALDGEGPFSPERSGTLPVGDLVRLCFSGKYSQEEIRKMITGKGGYVAYLGTNNAQEVEERALAGEPQAKRIRDAMIYQIAKEIGALSTVLEGEVEGILITGGIAYSESFTRDLSRRIKHLGPVFIYPGEDELRALAFNGLRVLEGKAIPQIYR